MQLRPLLQDWSLKLFSLGVAILLFLFVGSESATPADVDFRVEYRTADDIMITNDPPTILHTTLHGPWAAFHSFDPTSLEPVFIDLSQAGPGTVRHVIDMNAIKAPAGMRVVSIRPAELEVALDRRVERLVPVHPDIPDLPAFGYEILDVRIVPARARVIGPVSKMQTIDFISTRSIDVSSREDDLSLEVDLRPPPPPLRLVDKHVTVSVEIGEEFVQRTFQTVPVMLDNAPRGSLVTPPTVPITVKGPRRIVDKLEQEAIEAYVDVNTDVRVGQTQVEKLVQLRHDLPDRTQIVAPVPKVVVDIASKKSKRR